MLTCYHDMFSWNVQCTFHCNSSDECIHYSVVKLVVCQDTIIFIAFSSHAAFSFLYVLVKIMIKECQRLVRNCCYCKPGNNQAPTGSA